jgi:energy-coupling factor transporter ATP-binding protein EcfA2
MSVFAARYPGTCACCKQPITAGQLIKWNRKVRGVIYHANCSDVNAPKPAALPQELPDEDIKFPKAEYTDSDGITTDITIPEEVNVKSATDHAHAKMSTSDTNGVPTDKPAVIFDNATNSLMEGFASALMPHIESRLKTKADKDEIYSMITGYLQANPIVAPLSIEVKHTDGEVVKIDNAHASMPKLLYFIGKKHHVYMYGEPGSGKSTAAHQAATALKRPYGYISLNPQTPESRLLGYLDATGTYRPTVFYDIYKNGGVFCIDEIDNSSAALLTTLNGSLENGIAAFPCGMVERHPDFVCVGTGNTSGRGASYLFPDRRPFDAAMADRFTFLAWEYDTQLERSIAIAINPKAGAWVDFVQHVRQHVQTNKIRMIVSPRVSYKGAEYLTDDTLTKSEIADALLFKGIDPAIRTSILAAVKL